LANDGILKHPVLFERLPVNFRRIGLNMLDGIQDMT